MMSAGEPLLATAGFFVPTPSETRHSLLRIRRRFKLSRAQLAVILAISKDTLRRWETGERAPSTAARRLVQVVESLYFSERTSIFDFGGLLIGRLDLAALERTKAELLPTSIRPFLERFKRIRAKDSAHAAM
jgi:transcriptional regulator with XRE-family HTH domain